MPRRCHQHTAESPEHLLCGILAVRELIAYLVADGDAKLLQLWQ